MPEKYHYFSLMPGRIINQVHATVLLMQQEVIEWVHQLASQQQNNAPGIQFGDCALIPIFDDVDKDDDDSLDNDDYNLDENDDHYNTNNYNEDDGLTDLDIDRAVADLPPHSQGLALHPFHKMTTMRTRLKTMILIMSILRLNKIWNRMLK